MNMNRPLSILLLLLSGIVLTGCGHDIDPRGQRVPVDGEVTLDGQPLSRARIVFIGEAGGGSLKATAEIKDGSFVLTSADGPLPGTARVEIVPELLELEEFEAARGPGQSQRVEPRTVNIPARYNLQSKLTAQLEPATDNHLNFELFSR